MAGSYKYDEEGGQFLTFILTFVLLFLLPLTYSTIPSPSSAAGGKRAQGWFDKKGQKISSVKRLSRRTLLNPKISKRATLVAVGWIAVALLVQKLANTAATSSHTIYDPFAILGISSSLPEKAIKKHYKKLSIKFHPDKLVLGENQTKEEAESHFIELTKAYKSLTDETIRKNYELYGHPDGRQEMSMGIALPTWVVESQNNVWVLGAYGLLFGIGLPFLVARWWYGSRSRTKDQVYNATAQSYFQHLRDDTPLLRLISLLAISEEFRDEKLDVRTAVATARGKALPSGKALDDLEKLVRERLQRWGPEAALPPAFRSASTRKAVILIYAYLLRIDTPDAQLTKAKYLAASKALPLASSLLSISLGHNWLAATERVFRLQQHLVQAVPLNASLPVSELLQLPHMDLALADKLLRGSNGKCDLGIQGFASMTDAERKSVLGVGKNLSDPHYDEMVKVAMEWPRLELVNAYFKVAGERLVTSGAIVQFVVQVRLLPFRKEGIILRNGCRAPKALKAGETDVVPDTRKPTDEDFGRPGLEAEETDGGKQALGFTRAPYLVDERKPHWWIYLGDQKQDRVIVQPVRLSDIGPDKTRSFSVQFQAPPQAGLYTFQACVRSDSYLGSDASQYVKLQVEDPDVLDDGLEEDYISDPEEDT